MATQRRNLSDKRAELGTDNKNEAVSDTSPAVPAHVIYKLLGFTLAMVVGPIGTYFLTLDTVFNGNSTYAGATAALMANVVLVGYIIVAMMEDQSEAIEKAEKEKKGL